MSSATGAEVLDGLWRFEALHPEWSEAEGGPDGWDPQVAWWAIATPGGLVLVDPLVFQWDEIDELIAGHGRCSGIVRTCHWHQRSIAEAAARYGAEVWAKPPPAGVVQHHFDHPAPDGQEVVGGLVAFDVERADEVALWLPARAALLFGDAMVRREGGALRTCPDSWLQPEGGPARLRAVLSTLAELPLDHVLVSHGPNVLGDGRLSLAAAIA